MTLLEQKTHFTFKSELVISQKKEAHPNRGDTPHERGPEPVVSIAFCDMSQNVTKRRLTQPVVVFSPVVESENLKLPKLHFAKTGFAVSFGLD